MSLKQLRTRPWREPTSDYRSFDHLDGKHPWMTAAPDGFVAYRVRELKSGEIGYFNFVLAKEMGLIDPEHPQKVNQDLKQKLIDTFSVQIINEYDEITKRRIRPETIKPNKYMASRYLQLQHSNRQGKTSGDGRGIWNGTIRHAGTTWDVSSRGTGVTCLSPGAVEANRPLKTGAAEFGYGCGQAEIDELYGAAIMAEIMHLQGISTERVLCIIDLGKGYGIGVRAAPNLLRPAHLFRYLKQGNFNELKTATDYFINRQIDNRRWKFKARSEHRYDEMVDIISDSFARFTAFLDIDYIFAWLDWDGDNVLADAGIIDYGSVRQFGLRHDKYRYDDIERFSTNLNEQRQKARLMVQVFAQLSDFLKTKKKKPLKYFSKHPAVQTFNQKFQNYRSHRLLYRLGFTTSQRELILKNSQIFWLFEKEYNYFERAKISGSKVKVADGINHPALFNMRTLSKFISQHLLENGLKSEISAEEFFKVMLSSFAKSKDATLRPKHKVHIEKFQTLYKQMVEMATKSHNYLSVMKGISRRADKLNSDKRITGNALIQIVSEIIDLHKKGIGHSEIQSLIDQLIYENVGTPEVNYSRYFADQTQINLQSKMIAKLHEYVLTHREDI